MKRFYYIHQFKRLALGSAVAAVVLPFTAVPVSGQAPAPYGPVPNSRQVEWYHREMQMFLHFGMNTFTNLEWGTGNENPNTFAPTALDCGQWCRTAKNAGFKSMILVAKHHDGFCIWPSAYTTHDVASSSWRSGTGDVVREFTDSCSRYGLKPGIYLSGGDFYCENHGMSAAAYRAYYMNQTKELCNNYGTIWEMWWDGANSEILDSATLYHVADTIHRLQPDCAIWSDAAGRSRTAEMRWNGNESAQNGDPCWATMNVAWSNANNGVLSGTRYVPAEGDISARAGWFWHASGTYATRRTLATLIDAYCNSVGRNGGLLLNVPPDNRGRITTADSTRVDSLGMWVYGTFDTNLAAGATVTSLHPRGAGFEPANLVDGQESTYYAAGDAYRTDTITFNLGSSKTFDALMVQEVIALGHRTTRWSVDYSTNSTTWYTVSGASNKQSIGYKWIIRISSPVTASWVRLRITAGNACPALHTFGIYRQGYVHQPTTAVEPSSGRTPSVKSVTITIFGNPVALPASFAGRPVTVAVFDLNGRLVARTMISAGRSVGERPRNVLPPGIFMARCSAGGTSAVQKIFSLR
jgi:alpha-L-fucosidase